jgi:hypothetical protein
LAWTVTVVLAGQYSFGRQSTWLSFSQPQEPSTGTEVSTTRALSTAARSVTGPSGNLMLIGMPTPTVASSTGLMVARGVDTGANVVNEPLALVSLPSEFFAVAAYV